MQNNSLSGSETLFNNSKSKWELHVAIFEFELATCVSWPLDRVFRGHGGAFRGHGGAFRGQWPHLAAKQGEVATNGP